MTNEFWKLICRYFQKKEPYEIMAIFEFFKSYKIKS